MCTILEEEDWCKCDVMNDKISQKEEDWLEIRKDYVTLILPRITRF